MKRLFLIVGALVVAFCAFAQQRVPAAPYPIEVVQPNGDSLTIRLHGDERMHFTTTLDGYKIVYNKKKYYCYAKQNKQGKLVATCRKAKNEENRTTCEKKYLLKKGLKR